MLYLIGLGLNLRGISKEGIDTLKKCKKVYLENYTAELPYSIEEIKDILKRKIILANREKIESLELIDEAKKIDVALLVYGSPLIATTHFSLIQEAKKSKVNYQIIHNASILDAVTETGLQIYKFGKIASIPKWTKNYEPDSFIKIIKENQDIKAHTLILCDIGLNFSDTLIQLKKAAERNNFDLKKIMICQRLGTKNQKIFYKNFDELKKFNGVKTPYSMIIPSPELHFLEKEFLEEFK